MTKQPHVLHRYIHGYSLYAGKLRRSQWKSPDEIEAEQRRKLRELLRVATQVPYYRSLGIGPDDDLTKLPILNKATVRARFNDFINPHHPRRGVFEDHTSGSTGEPFRFLLTAEQKAYEMAYSIRFWRWAGYRTGDRIAAFRSYIPAAKQEPLWKLDRRMQTLFFSVYDMTPANLRQYVAEFNRYRPRFVRGYPSSIFAFAQFAATNGLQVHAPHAVLASSETLSPEMRAVIERTLQCPVFDWWGTNERVVTACQCEQRGAYHVNAEGGILELVPERSHYRMIGTGLINHVMPLIRYDLGDLATPAEACPCGRGLPVIGGILGRSDDLIVTGAEKFVPPVRFYTLFETYDQIRQFQVVQTAPNAVTVRLVPARALTEVELTGLRQKLQRFLGESVAVEFAIVDEIKPDPSGKVRTVIAYAPR
jgi:phenylacetate-CoA ligase